MLVSTSPSSFTFSSMMSAGSPSKAGSAKFVRRRASIVEDGEVELAVVLADARTTANDLLEIGHRADDAEEHDVLDHRRIDASGQQLRGGENDGCLGLDILKRRQISFANIMLIGGDTDDVVGILAHQVGVGVRERLAHLVGVLLVGAEDDGLGEAVSCLEIVGEVVGHGLGAGLERDDALEVAGGVLPVGYLAAKVVELPGVGAVALYVHIDDDAAHLIGREEAVLNALFETVGIDGIAEILVGVAVILAQRRGGHAELYRAREVFQDLAPGTSVIGAAPVRLIHDNEVEEVGRVFAIESGP